MGYQKSQKSHLGILSKWRNMENCGRWDTFGIGIVIFEWVWAYKKWSKSKYL